MLTARAGNTIKRLSGNSNAMFSKGLRDSAGSYRFKGRWPKHFCLLALRINLLKSKYSSHNHWAPRLLHWFVQWLASNLLFRIIIVQVCASSCVKPVRVSFGLTSPLQQGDRCLQMPCTRLCRCGMKSSPKC